tara:strand:+ start:22009 stop:22641 length:633 start_codon:yes stop_codon:yes gene_type:complete
MACVQSFPPKSAKECRKIIEFVDKTNPIISMMIEFEVLTGLRYSDYSKLKLSDLMINGQIREEITVVQTKPFSKRVSSGMKEKTARELSKVVVYINEQCRNVIDEIMFINNWDAQKDKSKLLFESSRKEGSPYTIQYINQLLKKAAFALKLTYPLSTHSFRKMFATFYIKNGAAIHQVRDALGQSSLQATDHYLRTFISENKQFSTKISF